MTWHSQIWILEGSQWQVKWKMDYTEKQATVGQPDRRLSRFLFFWWGGAWSEGLGPLTVSILMLFHFRRKPLTLVFNCIHSLVSVFFPNFTLVMSSIWILCPLPTGSYVLLAFLSIRNLLINPFLHKTV